MKVCVGVLEDGICVPVHVRSVTHKRVCASVCVSPDTCAYRDPNYKPIENTRPREG